jgi:hypothetical protein
VQLPAAPEERAGRPKTNDLSKAQDSDLDGNADYLNPDDDGDGIPTRYEGSDPDRNGDPSDAWDRDERRTPTT